MKYLRTKKMYHIFFILLTAVILQINTDAQISKRIKNSKDIKRATNSKISYKNYIWIEAENAAATNFSKEKTYNFYCSGRYALQLSKEADPTNKEKGYYATYVFHVPQTKSYDFWLGATPPGSRFANKPGYASPFDWKIDDGDYRTASAENTYTKKFYGIGGFYWIKIASGKLDAGKHTITIRINQKRSSGWDYFFYIDALMFIPTYSGDLVSLMKFPETAPKNFKTNRKGIRFKKINAYKYRIKRNKNDRKSIFNLLQIYGWLYDYPKAITLCRNYLKSNPKDIEIRLLLASNLAWSGKVADAISEYKNIISIDNKNIVSRKLLAVLAGWSSRYDIAIKNYKEIIKIDPKNIDAYISLATQYSWKGEMARALGIFEQAERIAPDNTKVLHALGDNYRWSGNPSKAIRNYKRIISLDQKDMQAYKKLALLYLELDQKDKAEEIIKEASRIQKAYPELSGFSLDVKGEQSKQITSSIREYKKKLAKTPEDLKTRKNLIDTYRWNKMADKSIIEYKKLLTMKMVKTVNATTNKMNRLAAATIELGMIQPYIQKIQTELASLQDFYDDIPKIKIYKLPENYTKQQAVKDHKRIQAAIKKLQLLERTLLGFNSVLAIHDRETKNFIAQKEALDWQLTRKRIAEQIELIKSDSTLGYRPGLITGLLELLYGSSENAVTQFSTIYNKNINKLIMPYLLAMAAHNNYNKSAKTINNFIANKKASPRVKNILQNIQSTIRMYKKQDNKTSQADTLPIRELLLKNKTNTQQAYRKSRELLSEQKNKQTKAFTMIRLLYEKAFLDLENKNIPLYKELGQHYMNKQEMYSAIDHYKMILDVQPLNVGINFKIGNLYEAAGHWRSAMNNYEICIDNQLESDVVRKRHYDLQKANSLTIKNEASYFDEKSVNRIKDNLSITLPAFDWLTLQAGYGLTLIDEVGGKSKTGQTYPGLQKGKVTAHSGFAAAWFNIIPLKTKLYLEGTGNYYSGDVNFKDYDSYDSTIDYFSLNYAAGLQVYSLFNFLSIKLGYRHEDIADLTQALRLNNRDEITSDTIEATLDFSFYEFKFPFSDRIFLYDSFQYRMLSDSNIRTSSYNELTLRLLRFTGINLNIDLAGIYSYENSDFQSYNYEDPTRLSFLSYWAPENLHTYGGVLRLKQSITNFLNGTFNYSVGFQYSLDSDDNTNYSPGARLSYKSDHLSVAVSYYYTHSVIKATKDNPDPDPYISHSVNFSISGRVFSIYKPKKHGKKAVLFVTASPTMITPDGDGKDDFTTITLNAFDERGIKSWNLEIFNSKAKKVRNFGNKGTPPQTVRWDGTDKANNVLPQGLYQFQLSIINSGGKKTTTKKDQLFLARRKRAVVLETLNKQFSPNGDGKKDKISFEIKATEKNNIESWKMVIRNPRRGIVRTITGFEFLPYSVQWDGKNNRGDLLPDGFYTAELNIVYTDKKRIRSPRKKVTIITKASIKIRVNKKMFIPGEDKIKILPVYPGTEVSSWKLTIKDSIDRTLRIIHGSGSVPKQIDWDGTDEKGKPACFNMFVEAHMELTDTAGNTGSSNKQKVWTGFMKKINDGKTIFILFDQDILHKNKKSTFSKNAKEIIARLIKEMRSSTQFKNIKITAHTSQEGVSGSNKKLSEKRARLLAQQLQNAFKGIEITSEGAGESTPYKIEKSKWDVRYEIELY